MTRSKRNQLSRRRFIARLGMGAAAGAALPYVPLVEQEAAADATYPRRFILFCTPNGTVYENWRPTGTETSFTLSRILSVLEPYRSKLVVCDGIDQTIYRLASVEVHNEYQGMLLTGHPLTANAASHPGSFSVYGGGISIDQVIASRIGSATPLASIELGVRQYGHYLYTAPEMPLSPENDPAAAYDRLFAGVSASPDMTEDQRSIERRRIFDIVRRQLDATRGRISTAERYKIDAHIDAIDSVQRSLDALALASGCSAARPDFTVSGRSSMEIDAYPEVMELQFEVARASLSCDLTRVLTIMAGTSGNANMSFPSLGISEDHHDLGHRAASSPDAAEKQTRIEEMHAAKFKHLLDLLDSVSEPDDTGSTLLDHSIVAWVNTIGTGGHVMANLPIVLAGSGCGALRTGRFVDFGGQSHQNLLVSFARLMGLSDVTTFGHPDYCTGALRGL